MSFSFVGKKLLAAARSSSTLRHAATVINNRVFCNDPYNTSILNMIKTWGFKSVPHTIFRMSRETGDGRLEVITKSWGKKDPPRYIIPEGLKLSINIPGIEKVTETDEGLCVFIDLGLNEPDMKDFDDHQVEVKLKKVEALFIQGYVEKQGTRKNFYGRVNFTPMQTLKLANEKPIKTEIKDGGLMVTIAKKLTHYNM